MPEHPDPGFDPKEGGRGLDRLITFLDAIVAIAITLLVLPLIELVNDEPHASTGTILSDHVDQLIVFVLSFFVIARLWRVHHVLLEHARSYDMEFLWINFVWVLTIVVIPFATQLTTHGARTDRVTLAVYLGTMTVSSLCLTAIAVMLQRRSGLREANDPRPIRVLQSIASTVAFVIALVLAITVPDVGYWGLLLLVFDGRIASRVERGLHGRSAAKG